MHEDEVDEMKEEVDSTGKVIREVVCGNNR